MKITMGETIKLHNLNRDEVADVFTIWGRSHEALAEEVAPGERVDWIMRELLKKHPRLDLCMVAARVDVETFARRLGRSPNRG